MLYLKKTYGGRTKVCAEIKVNTGLRSCGAVHRAATADHPTPPQTRVLLLIINTWVFSNYFGR